jgi:uncharacterized protein (TIGR03086 family)
MDILANYDRASAAAAAILDKIDPGQYGRPTPCTKWTVRDVVNHFTGGNLHGAAMLRGRDPSGRDTDHLGDDPRAAFRRSLAEARSAMTEPGALEKTVATPLGEHPGVFVVHMLVNELIVHSWDLAKATGQSTDIEPDLAEGALTQAKDQLSQAPRPEGGLFAAQQDPLPGATAADRLAAFLGRAQEN